jgi:hypothetical protein
MFIPDPDIDLLPIPDPGFKRHQITDSGSATLIVPDLPVRLSSLLYDFWLEV